MERLSDKIEDQIIEMILSGVVPPGATLPLERKLAESLKVGRPTLREALQRLERDGWITIKKGSATLVNNVWESGNLNIISKVIQHPNLLPREMVMAFLELRTVIAPAYIQSAVLTNPARVVAVLVASENLSEDNQAFADFDWYFHKSVAALSNNPFYTLLLNSFDGIYPKMAADYFKISENRAASRIFYDKLLKAAMASDSETANKIAKQTMAESMVLWKKNNAKRESKTNKISGVML